LYLHVLQESRREILMREDSDNSDVSLKLSRFFNKHRVTKYTLHRSTQ